jgi:hypothetical protein
MMHLGYVREVENEAKFYLFIIEANKRENYSNLYFDYFNYKSKSIVGKYRLVVFDIVPGKNLVENVHDLDMHEHPEIFELLINHRAFHDNYYSFSGANPLLWDYFLNNVYGVPTFFDRLNLSLKNNDYFIIDKLIEQYSINIEIRYNYRRNENESAEIYIESKDIFIDNDEYIRNLFPIIKRCVAADCKFEDWHSILARLWDELGGENGKKKLEQECRDLEIAIKSDAKKNYDSTKHRSYIEEEYRKEFNRIRNNWNKNEM